MAIEVDRSRQTPTPPPNRPLNDISRAVPPRYARPVGPVAPAPAVVTPVPVPLPPAAAPVAAAAAPAAAPPPETLASLQPSTGGSAAGGVSIQIQMPNLDFSRQREQLRRLAAQAKRLPLPALSRRQVVVGTLTVAVVAAAAFGTQSYLHQQHLNKVAPIATGTAVAAVAAKPTFTPAVPADKPQLGTLGKQSAFDGNRGVYSFIDTLDKQQITVSEQKYGDKFSSAAVAASTIGKQLGPTIAVKTPWGDGFVATNPKYNSQTLVAPVKNLLVFIQSSQTHPADSWQTYLAALK